MRDKIDRRDGRLWIPLSRPTTVVVVVAFIQLRVRRTILRIIDAWESSKVTLQTANVSIFLFFFLFLRAREISVLFYFTHVTWLVRKSKTRLTIRTIYLGWRGATRENRYKMTMLEGNWLQSHSSLRRADFEGSPDLDVRINWPIRPVSWSSR